MVKQKYDEYYDGVYRVCELGEYIIAHQGICHGQPTFKGTRKLVHLVIESLGQPGRTIEGVAADYELPIEAVQEAVLLAAQTVREKLRLPNPHGEPGKPPPFKQKPKASMIEAA
jgi:uncharacterized protein (DUF433 family)